MPRLALVRHPPVSGGAGLCYGRRDLPLARPATDLALLVTRLAPLRGARILASPLSRCWQVAEALGQAWGGPPPRPDARLLELDFGAWEGQAWADVPRASLDAWAADLPGFAPPGGESGASLIARVSSLWTDLWAEIRAADAPVILITHGGPLKILTALAAGQPVDLAAPAPPMGDVRFFIGPSVTGLSKEASPMAQPAPAPTAMETLLELRRSIDNIDAAMIHMLAERFRCTKAVGALKARHDLPPADPVREEQQIARLRALAKTADLDPDFAETFLAFIIREVIRHHEAARQA